MTLKISTQRLTSLTKKGAIVENTPKGKPKQVKPRTIKSPKVTP